MAAGPSGRLPLIIDEDPSTPLIEGPCDEREGISGTDTVVGDGLIGAVTNGHYAGLQSAVCIPNFLQQLAEYGFDVPFSFLVAIGFYFGVVNPILEEWFWRVFLYRELGQRHPKRLALKAKLAAIPPKMVSIQINNNKYEEPANQTILQVAHKHGVRIPHNCRAGICWACEANVNGKPTQTCYTPIQDGMYVVEKAREMMHWRQHTGDE
ncbi:hypothetical protein FOL47_005247 [Perkinsus chesapeaki]|uniref:2Fe-2S ferredoxin-type domain-containing protein n=1 Tax=Perkinsus chesapeaki TaxID=330153 RepID=A0A7J6LY67_PERCH|nr:hypothetical protein FOL47_005247 [Perkinsus chesapeaki]